jgi:tetratricopeptide (TPR) repeat protein
MNKLILFLIVIVMSPSGYLFAATYGDYDVRKVVSVREDANGKKLADFDMNYLDKITSDLSAHAENYPPRFDTDEDKTKARKDVGQLIYILGVLKEGNGDKEIMIRAGHIYSIAHNLDVPGAAEKAKNVYSQLISRYPDDSNIAYKYGVFLAGTGQLDESIPYLNEALSAGILNANFSIGMVYLAKGDKKKALSYLKKYVAVNPKDVNASHIIEAIESGNVKLERK